MSETEIYSVVVVTEDYKIESTHVTLDRGKALIKAYDMYYDCQDYQPCCNVFIDTWRDDVIVKTEYIDSNGKIVVRYENYNV